MTPKDWRTKLLDLHCEGNEPAFVRHVQTLEALIDDAQTEAYAEGRKDEREEVSKERKEIE